MRVITVEQVEGGFIVVDTNGIDIRKVVFQRFDHVVAFLHESLGIPK